MKRLLLVVFAMSLASCVPLEPYRYTVAQGRVDCMTETGAPACRTSSSEHNAVYDLHFVEFDDQGLQYPADVYPDHWKTDAPGLQLEAFDCDLKRNDCLHARPWAYQINNLIKQLNVAVEDPCYNGVTLVVFIHGWKHNAREDDENLKGFRAFLASAALIEKERRMIKLSPGDGAPAAVPLEAGTPCIGKAVDDEARKRQPRRIVGLYVSWRGNSIDLAPVDNLTFWSRKTAAMHVAQGSSRELFARLRGFKCVNNSIMQADGSKSCNRPPSHNDKIQIVLIGHSFGGLILYNSLSGSLIESMTHAFDSTSDPTTPYWRFADLAVMINPAFEATRYTPLHRIASSGAYDHYEVPLLVTVTSTTDAATRYAFNYGRAINTFFERHASTDEAEANRQTIGHHAPYVTHRLELPDEASRFRCEGWELASKEDAPRELAAKLERDLPIEFRNSSAFYRSQRASPPDAPFRLKPDWVREFCGGVRLTALKGTEPNSPIWNVSAIGHGDLLPNHSDIMEPLFVAFFRQLYLDTFFLEDMTRRR
jgi:hypothetical protein